MASNILGIGQSALAAAQAGLSTTGHNIANASTPGYSRQIVVQGSAGAQDTGVGYIGKGATVTDVRRIYSDLLGNQLRGAQTSANQVQTYYTQISRINNQLGDSTAGLSPALQDFFKGVQDLAGGTGSAASRQSTLSSAEALTARFQSLDGQLREAAESVNTQIQSSVSSINVYATEIAKLNDAIEKTRGVGDGKAPNDLLDQRDLAITELSKEIKTTVVKQGNSYNVFIGNGQPLVVGAKTTELVANSSLTDPSRTTVGIYSNGGIVSLAESSLPGGRLGGLFEFRANSLDSARNALGRIAIGLGASFNEQHRLGQDANGDAGGDFFNVAAPRVDASTRNNTASAAKVDAVITDPGKLTTSDYRLRYDGTDFIVTRLSDNQQVYPASSTPSPAPFPSSADVIEGVTLSLASGSFTAGDEFVIRPTVDGAANFSVAIKDINKIAAAAPITTAASTANSGSGKISAGSVDASFAAANVTPAVTLSYDAATNELSGFPATLPVTVSTGSTTTSFPAGTPVTYTDGATISFGGASFTISGTPIDGDTFTVGKNLNGTGDIRNAVLLGELQSANTLVNGTTSYQGAYAQLVSSVGNKAREMEVTSKAENRYLEGAEAAQQAESGVNLDEEATNLLRYQQAYQAAAKVMQTANQLFDLLLTLGN